MKLTEVKRDAPTDALPPVPQHMWDMIDYLNKLLEAMPLQISDLIDWSIPVDERKFEEFPNVILRDASDAGFGYELSVLGLLAGYVNTKHFRLFAEFDETIAPFHFIKRFGVFRTSE